MGDRQGLPIQNTGNTSLLSSFKSFDLNNVLHVPKLTKNLLSVHKFPYDNSYFFEFWPTHFLIKDQVTKTVLLRGPSEDGLFSIRSPKHHALVATVPTIQDQHAQKWIVSKIVKDFKLPQSSISFSPSSSCYLGKFSKIPFSTVTHLIISF